MLVPSRYNRGPGLADCGSWDMTIIQARNLSKSYRISEKQPGLAGSLRHLLRRVHRDVVAVDQTRIYTRGGGAPLGLCGRWGTTLRGSLGDGRQRRGGGPGAK